VIPHHIARAHDDLVSVSDDVGGGDMWLVTHPEFRRDPKVRATTDFLEMIATGPNGLC
jgi:DNA-binding transcriptional LysR family regulator